MESSAKLVAATNRRGPIPSPGSGLEPRLATPVDRSRRRSRAGGLLAPRNVFLWPALLVVLALSIFPLIVSLYLSLSRLQFTANGIDIRFIGLNNYQTLLFGSEQIHFVGLLKPPTLARLGDLRPRSPRRSPGAVPAADPRRRRGRSGSSSVPIGGLAALGLSWLARPDHLRAGRPARHARS